MANVRVSPKFQVVIPKNVRRSMGLQPGRTLQVLQYADRIELVPIGPVRKLRGFLKGMNTRVERDADRP